MAVYPSEKRVVQELCFMNQYFLVYMLTGVQSNCLFQILINKSFHFYSGKRDTNCMVLMNRHILFSHVSAYRCLIAVSFDCLTVLMYCHLVLESLTWMETFRVTDTVMLSTFALCRSYDLDLPTQGSDGAWCHPSPQKEHKHFTGLRLPESSERQDLHGA